MRRLMPLAFALVVTACSQMAGPVVTPDATAADASLDAPEVAPSETAVDADADADRIVDASVDVETSTAEESGADATTDLPPESPDSACPAALACGTTCCDPGFTCIDAASGACCPSKRACGDICCAAGDACAAGEQCGTSCGQFIVLDKGIGPGPDGTGLVYDTKTNLRWLRYSFYPGNPPGLTQPQAAAFCTSSGLELPTQPEALAIAGAAYDACAWPDDWNTWTTSAGASGSFQGVGYEGSNPSSAPDNVQFAGALCRAAGLP